MAHHKRGKRKDSRSGCLLCKPHKSTCSKDSWSSQTYQEQRSRISEREQLDDLGVVSVWSTKTSSR